jgi:hypothetical protein
MYLQSKKNVLKYVPMKIYFTSSARASQELKQNYKTIFELISSFGHSHVDDYTKSDDAQKVYFGTHEENLKLYKHAMECIKNADAIVLEVSTHSLSMGYLLQQSLTMGKPVIALYVVGNKPAFVAGIDNEKLQLVEYTAESLKEELSIALQNAQENTDVRFNFFISPSIGRYLDWVSKVKKIPRSVYLRALIEKEIGSNQEYTESL